MKQETKDKIIKVEFVVALGLILLLSLSLIENSGITGYFVYTFSTQELNLKLTNSQSFLVVTDKPDEFNVTSLKLDGFVSGGKVEIYLENGLGQRLLIYSNIAEPKYEGLVTGFIVNSEEKTKMSNLEESDWVKLIYLGDEEESLELSGLNNLNFGHFDNKCIETCSIDMQMSRGLSYRLVAYVEPGAVFELNKILYTIKINKEEYKKWEEQLI